jgi:hypothetical protein
MKRALLGVVVACGIAVLTTYAAEEKEKSKLDGIKCPVSGKVVKEDQSVEHRSGKVYFCCGGCPDEFKGNKAKYSTKANHQLVATGQAKQAKCPLSGGDLNKDTAITIDKAKLAFCCNNCKGKVEKEKGDAQLEMAFSDKAFDKAGFKIEEKK